jgi:HEAT repeat protein
MNSQSAQPEMPFEHVLEALLDETSPIAPQVILRLSDIEGEALQKVRAIWPRISPERRLNLLEEMETLVEDNHILSFENITKIALHDDDAQVRFLAVRSLSIYETTDLIPELLERVENDSDPNVRTACAFSLGRFAYLAELDQFPAHIKQAIHACLFKIVNGEDEDIIRCQALESLGYFTHSDIPALLREAVKSDDIIWQASALSAMGHSCDSRWAPQIEIMLENPSPVLRLEAVRAAGELGLGSAKSQMFELLDDAVPEIHLAAIWALSQIGGEGVTETLEELLKQAQNDDEADFIEDALDNLASSDDFDIFELLDIDDDADFYNDALTDPQ